jgi:F0F1-type ATP synthase assembly protein I
MNGRGNGSPTEVSRRAAAAEGRAEGLNVGWTVSSYLLSGMAAYGIIGWLIGRAVHVSLLFPIGMLVGLGISIAFIIYRYGRVGLGGQGGRVSPQERGVPGGSTPRASTEGDDR